MIDKNAVERMETYLKNKKEDDPKLKELKAQPELERAQKNIGENKT